MRYLFKQLRRIRLRARLAGSDRRGIGLLEAMVALLVLMIGIVAGLVLMLSSTFAARISRDQLIASNLAREGVEIVRSVRDSNWLKIEAGEEHTDGSAYKWDDGLWGFTSVDGYLYTALPTFNSGTRSWSLDYRKANSFDGVWGVYFDPANGGFYNQYSSGSSGTLTKYARRIYTYPICFNGTDESYPSANCAVGETKVGIQVKVDVRWNDNGQTRTVSVEDRLYNWK